MVHIALSNRVALTQRSIYTTMDLLGDAGGVNDAFVMIGSLLASLLVPQFGLLEQVTDIFRFNPSHINNNSD